MKKIIATFAVSAMLAGPMASTSANALSDDEKKALAAAAILGIAALAHNKNHYHEGYQPKDADSTAQFERGYRDGLHNERYDSRHSGENYAQGYDAGQKERQNRLSHKTRDVHGTKVPTAAIRSCKDEVASSLNVGKHDVHLIKAGQEGSDNFYIEMAAGHKHLICGSSGAGKVFNLRNGRL
ncbi:hypothetical protein [uncultured Shimia sp.]|uniref:hypothetical protein n=1 Tax=uncultured Shimia sp. TaxID=573152 RepID=UPI00260EDE03|nr:hypothetical protein [uncultured Shimia sp.]